MAPKGASLLKVSRQPSGEPEIFHSIQGEGVSAGTPTVFLRLATCNLACTWCDTRYTWDWRRFDFASGRQDFKSHDRCQHGGDRDDDACGNESGAR